MNDAKAKITLKAGCINCSALSNGKFICGKTEVVSSSWSVCAEYF